MTEKVSSPSQNFNPVVTGLLVALVVILAVAPLVLIRGAEFGGADDAAQEVISEISPETKPWFQPLWSPPGGEVATFLFSLQAAIGAGAIGYYLGLKKGRKEE